MQVNPDHRVKIVVTASGCPLMPEGATVYLDGALIDYRKSAPVCVTALAGIYPWVMTARFGIESPAMGYAGGYRVSCPDKLVEFAVIACPPGTRS